MDNIIRIRMEDIIRIRDFENSSVLMNRLIETVKHE